MRSRLSNSERLEKLRALGKMQTPQSFDAQGQSSGEAVNLPRVSSVKAERVQCRGPYLRNEMRPRFSAYLLC
jgi:hypothetical protein